jgi:hypothetical protein
MRRPIVRVCNKKYLDGDCPDGILCIFDHPDTGDRYTVIYKEVHEHNGTFYVMGRGMSENPTHPQGVGQSFEMKVHELRAYRNANKRRYIKWTSLPDKVKSCVRRDLKPE